MPAYEIVIIILLAVSLMFLKMRKNKLCMFLITVALFIFVGELLNDAAPMYLIMTSGIMGFGEIFGVVIMDILPTVLFIVLLICLHKHKNKTSARLMGVLLFVFIAGNWNTWLELIFRLTSGV